MTGVAPAYSLANFEMWTAVRAEEYASGPLQPFDGIAAIKEFA